MMLCEKLMKIRPVRTYNTAAVYYHKFRLAHPDNEYNFLVRTVSTVCYGLAAYSHNSNRTLQLQLYSRLAR